MQQTIPDDLQQAINEVYLWAEDGCPPHKYLDVVVGLCANLSRLTDYELNEICELLFGENRYPFNRGRDGYVNESNRFTNPKRLAWLKTHQTVD